MEQKRQQAGALTALPRVWLPLNSAKRMECARLLALLFKPNARKWLGDV